MKFLVEELRAVWVNAADEDDAENVAREKFDAGFGVTYGVTVSEWKGKGESEG